MKYILSPTAIKGINETPGIKAKLMLALNNLSEGSINRLIRENAVNSDLTKASSLEVLRVELKLKDSQILLLLTKKEMTKETRIA